LRTITQPESRIPKLWGGGKKREGKLQKQKTQTLWAQKRTKGHPRQGSHIGAEGKFCTLNQKGKRLDNKELEKEILLGKGVRLKGKVFKGLLCQVRVYGHGEKEGYFQKKEKTL